MLDEVGYEDLLVALAHIYDKQVFLDSHRSNIIPKNFQHIFSESERTSTFIVKNLVINSETPLMEIER